MRYISALPIDDITTVMQTLFHCQRFDAKQLRQKYSSTHHKYEESEAEESDDSGYDTDPESDSEEEDKKLKQKSSKQTKGKSHSPSPNASSTKPKPAKTINSTLPKKAGTKDDSIDDLISKMSKLSINEPAYAVAYFKALTISPIISEVFARPIIRGNTSRPNRSNQDQVCNTPISQNNTNGNQPPIMTYSQYLGCGSPEHLFQNCPAIREKIAKQQLVYTPDNRLALPGSERPLRKRANQTLLEAYQEATQHTHSNIAQHNSNLVTVQAVYNKRGSSYYVIPEVADHDMSDDLSDSRLSDRNYCNEQNDDDIDMDDTTEGPQSTTNTVHYTYVAKETTTARRQAFNGVYIPPSRQKPDQKPVGNNRQGRPSHNEVVLTQGDQNDRIPPPQLDQRAISQLTGPLCLYT